MGRRSDWSVSAARAPDLTQPSLCAAPAPVLLCADHASLPPSSHSFLRYRRSTAQNVSHGNSLLREAAEPTLVLAAEAVQQQQARAGSAASGTPAAEAPPHAHQHQQAAAHALQEPAAAAASCDAADACGGLQHGQDKLQRQLGGFMVQRHIHLLSNTAFCMNTLSRYQLGRLMVASFPLMPSFTAVMAVLHDRLAAQHTQRMARLEQQAAAGCVVAAELEQGAAAAPLGDWAPPNGGGADGAAAARAASVPPSPAGAGARTQGGGQAGTPPSSGGSGPAQQQQQQPPAEALPPLGALVNSRHWAERSATLELHSECFWRSLPAPHAMRAWP